MPVLMGRRPRKKVRLLSDLPTTGVGNKRRARLLGGSEGEYVQLMQCVLHSI